MTVPSGRFALLSIVTAWQSKAFTNGYRSRTPGSMVHSHLLLVLHGSDAEDERHNCAVFVERRSFVPEVLDHVPDVVRLHACSEVRTGVDGTCCAPLASEQTAQTSIDIHADTGVDWDRVAPCATRAECWLTLAFRDVFRRQGFSHAEDSALGSLLVGKEDVTGGIVDPLHERRSVLCSERSCEVTREQGQCRNSKIAVLALVKSWSVRSSTV